MKNTIGTITINQEERKRVVNRLLQFAVRLPNPNAKYFNTAWIDQVARIRFDVMSESGFSIPVEALEVIIRESITKYEYGLTVTGAIVEFFKLLYSHAKENGIEITETIETVIINSLDHRLSETRNSMLVGLPEQSTGNA